MRQEQEVHAVNKSYLGGIITLQYLTLNKYNKNNIEWKNLVYIAIWFTPFINGGISYQHIFSKKIVWVNLNDYM